MTSVGLLDAIEDILTQLDNLQLVGKPLFKRIDIWNNQLEYEKNDNSGYTVPSPAIFLEMRQLSSKQLGEGINMMDYEVVFHIIDTQLNNGSKLDRNTKVFGLRNLVKQKFQLYQPKQMGKLFFIKDGQDFKHNNLYHFVLTFKGAVLDSWGNNKPVQGTASTVLTMGYTGSQAFFGVGFDSISGPTFSGTLIVYP